MNDKPKLIAVTKLSTRGTSIRMTLPKEIAEKLSINEGDHIGFYEENGKVFVRKIE